MDEPRDPTASSQTSSQTAPETSSDAPAPAEWQPLSAIQRRVLGVLVEKAKTTPDSYPMTLNALTNGCNQKSNRSPQMNLTPDDVEDTIHDLRELKAVVEIQGGGRVNKYRHRLYDWLGVSKVELAVMAELLLRGEQTVGELRGRAARMEPIADLSALRPIVRSLIEKDLVISLTPEGRGQVVTHNLYTPRELAAVRERVGAGEASEAAPRTQSSPSSASPSSQGGGGDVDSSTAQQLQRQIDELRNEVEQLRKRLDDLA